MINFLRKLFFGKGLDNIFFHSDYFDKAPKSVAESYANASRKGKSSRRRVKKRVKKNFPNKR